MQLHRRVVNWRSGIFGVSCSLAESPQRGGGAEFYNLFSDEKVSGGAAQKLSTRDKTGIWFRVTPVDGPRGLMPIIGFPLPRLSYHFLAGERKRKAMPSCQRQVLWQLRNMWVDSRKRQRGKRGSAWNRKDKEGLVCRKSKSCTIWRSHVTEGDAQMLKECRKNPE